MLSASTVFNTTHASGHAQITNVNINGNFVQNVYTMTPDQKYRIYQWLDAPDSSGNFLAAREKHHEETGTWFIEGEEYLRWKETPDSSLWIYGTPGCGKTIICSTIIEKIRAECAAEPSFAYAYFFFDGRDARTNLSLHSKLIRSIVKQLSHQSSSFPASLVELYGSGQEQPSVASLQITLQKIIDGFQRTYIVIDAIDECSDRDKMLVWIEQLAKRKTGNLQVLFSSRPEQDIKDKLKSMTSLARVTLNSRLAENDIETFIDAMLSMMIGKWDAQTIARVKDALMVRSDGMFRWVALQISDLVKCASRKAVENQLRDLPRDLEGMYERSLLRSPRRQDLKQFLMWLSFSARPLERQELADVVTMNFSSNGLPSYDPDLQYFSPADVLITCSSFVTETQVTPISDGDMSYIRVIKLAHMSVKDYLVSDRLKNGPASYFSINAVLAHSLIAKTCLAYIFHLRSVDAWRLYSFPLGAYAARYWITHMRLGGSEAEHLSQMMDCIFSPEEGALANWVILDDPDQPEWHYIRTNIAKRFSEIAAPLYYACIHGLHQIAQELLRGGMDANSQGGHYGNALQAASLRGNNTTVRLLLDHGADVNAQGGEYGNALQASTLKGHEAIVRLLLDNGAYVNAQGGYHGSALQAASLEGRDVIIGLLLAQDADANAQGGYYGNALQAASLRGFDFIVRLLLGQGADVNAQGGQYGTALQAAAHQGRGSTVRLLLEKGARVNVQGGFYGNALQDAVISCHNDIVRLLLEHGADVNAQGGHYGNALQAASYEYHGTSVRLLLKHGADVNAQGGCYGNALQAASDGGDDTVVRLLLEHGADVNAQGGNSENALYAASKGGHDAVIRLLLEKGANVNAQGGYYGNALQATLSRGFDAIVQFVHEEDDGSDTQGGTYGPPKTPSVRGLDAIVRLLLEHGADVNAEGGWYGNALQAALDGGDIAIVRLLLEQGADVNAKGHFGSAVQAARFGGSIHTMGHGLIMQLLLEHGAIVEDLEDKDYLPVWQGEDNVSEEQDGNHSSAGNNSEDEWASAQEDVEDT